MKIFRFFTGFLLIALILPVNAQDGSASPYSFFGLGDPVFKGTVENMGMGSIHSYMDSIHYNISVPASLTALKYANLNLGLKNDFISVADNQDKEWFSTHNISYFSLAFPIGKKFGAGLGILPVSASDYNIYQTNDLGTYTFHGEGGNTRIFFAGGYQLNKYVSIGLEYQYYFGYLNHENIWVPNNVFTYTKENNSVDFKGSTFKFSSAFKYKINKKHYANIQAGYRFKANLTTEYKSISRLLTLVAGNEETVENLDETQETGTMELPAYFDFGLGYGKNKQWYVGFQYDYTAMKNFKNPYYDPSYLQYNNAYSFRIGGLYTPQYNSITKYWKRVTYKAGAYFKNTGMNIYGEDISDFGITFGLSLPSLRGISNMNIGVMLGQRGKISGGLVEEKYVNLHISLSLNEKWFIKRKIN
jgi:hypothetical protein